MKVVLLSHDSHYFFESFLHVQLCEERPLGFPFRLPYFCDLGREYPLLSATESGSDCVCSIPIAGAEEQNTVDDAERLSSVKESAKVVGQLCWLMPGSMLGSECCGSARECEA